MSRYIESTSTEQQQKQQQQASTASEAASSSNSHLLHNGDGRFMVDLDEYDE